MQKPFSIYPVLIPLYFLTLISCSYNWDIPEDPICLSIPLIEKDTKGAFTKALVQKVSASPYFCYAFQKAPLRLKVNLVEERTEKIGFQREKERSSNRAIRLLRPVENRDTLLVEVSLVSASDKTVWGPFLLQESVDYDYADGDAVNDLAFTDQTGQRQTTLQFSLGQLEGLFPAKRAAKKRLYQKMAQKIVETLSLDYAP